MTMLGDSELRSAESVYHESFEGQSFIVGENGVNAIWVYWENGEMAMVPFIQMEFDDGSSIVTSAQHYAIRFNETLQP